MSTTKKGYRNGGLFFTQKFLYFFLANYMKFNKNSYQNCLLVLMFFSITACGYLIQPKVKTGIVHLKRGEYQIDKQHTSVIFKINHMGLSTFVGRFNDVDATLVFDPQNMANAKLSAIITIASIDVNSKTLEETLRGDSFFAAEKFPQAFYQTESVLVLDEKRARFTGNLTLHGITAPLVLDVEFNGGGENLLTGRYTIGFSATAVLKRSQFEISYLIPAVSDEVNIEVFSELQKNE